jgi:hypothetical protein
VEPISHRELADSIDALVASVAEPGKAADWEFTDASPARLDWIANELPGAWGDRPLQDAYRTGLLSWWLVADHALALADAIRADRALAYLSLARGLADACVRSWFLLELEVPPKERVRRLMNDRLHAMFEQNTLLSGDPRFADTLAHNAESKEQIRLGARRHNLHFDEEVRSDERFAAARLAPSRPSTVELLRRGIRQRESASAFYRTSSALTHASLHAVASRIRFNAELGRVALQSLDADRVVADCTRPLVAMLVTMATTLEQTGWARSRFDECADDARTLWSHAAGD